MTRPALDVDRGEQRAAAGDADVEPRRLRHDRGVGAQRAGGREPARAGRLLLADGVHDQVAAQPDAELRERLGGRHHRGHAALHVARAAAVDRAVVHLARERVARPRRPRPGRDHVDVAVEQQRAAAPRAAEPRDELGPPGEREAGRDVGMAGDELRRRLEERHVRAVALQPPGEEALEPGDVAARDERLARRGVEADQAPQQRHELRLAACDVRRGRAARDQLTT